MIGSRSKSEPKASDEALCFVVEAGGEALDWAL
jgi:hypothetical protein